MAAMWSLTLRARSWREGVDLCVASGLLDIELLIICEPIYSVQ